MTSTTKENHQRFLRQCIDLAKKSPPKPTNFRVGAVLVRYPETNHPEVLSTGYTLEQHGNTHAEQNALDKYLIDHWISGDEEVLVEHLVPQFKTCLYTSLEPCSVRLSGNTPCVQRIINAHSSTGGIRKVIFGAKEPGTFVKDSQSCKLLTEAGVEWEYVPDFEEEILSVAMEGHKKEKMAQKEEVQAPKETNTTTNNALETEMAGDLMPPAELQPKNPKKRMMEAPPGSEESWK